ncbi:hypothetical protein BaRGS_00023287, partial [Batillaria attramentaria]
GHKHGEKYVYDEHDPVRPAVPTIRDQPRFHFSSFRNPLSLPTASLRYYHSPV